MKEDLITCETAVLANEKGFDWEVDNYYHAQRPTDELTVTLRENQPKGNYNHHASAWQYSAPRQSLLQKWLREKHKKHVHSNIGTFCDKINDYENFYFDIYPDDINSECDFDTYEQALEVGLQEALKLIP